MKPEGSVAPASFMIEKLDDFNDSGGIFVTLFLQSYSINTGR